MLENLQLIDSELRQVVAQRRRKLIRELHGSPIQPPRDCRSGFIADKHSARDAAVGDLTALAAP
jgi:hypothetical protein